jgi:phosphoribosylanthranilate isomerase
LALNSKSGWFLAGGLNPENVATAISVLQPDVVDVSSGVTMPDGLQKDPARISAFINAANGGNLTKAL